VRSLSMKNKHFHRSWILVLFVVTILTAFAAARLVKSLHKAPNGARRAATGNVSIGWSDVHQSIDGFGAATSWTGEDLSDAQADMFFSPSKGAGLSLVRNMVPYNGGVRGIMTMQKAFARGARIWSAPWTPPPQWKDNHDPHGGVLLTSHYQDYANYLVNYILTLKNQYGIDLYALSIQNEPDVQSTTVDSCGWTGDQMRTFIKNNLAPGLHRNAIATKIMMPEIGGWTLEQFQDYGDPILNDPIARNYVEIIAGHSYRNRPFTRPTSPDPYPLAKSFGKRLWQTEVADVYSGYKGIASGLEVAKQVHDWMTVAEANAWHYWWLISPHDDNWGLAPGPSKRLWALGNYSKFVRPGYYRIGANANPLPGIYITAYKDHDTGEFAIVAINQNSSNTRISFTFNGFAARLVTPWITSASLDLAQRSPIAAGNSFSAILTAQSVTTFVGKRDPYLQ
jgi:glucuronoarabinoxylan endo-1,4-beta-xylanase